jgi:GNAT superfamily N-acetyltransferase/quercetin dioxygenase-like cupin family protein
VSMNAEQTMLEAFKRRPTVEMSTWYKGILVSHLATEKDTGGAFDLVMSRMRSGTEPPPHIHEREHEVFYVLDGELEVYVAGEYFRASVGECVFLPARKAHAFKIASLEIRMLVMVTPGGFLNSISSMAMPAQKLDIPRDETLTYVTANLEETAKIFDRYGVRFLSAEEIALELPQYPSATQVTAPPLMPNTTPNIAFKSLTASDNGHLGRKSYVLRPHRPGDRGWVVSRHGELYARQYGCDEHFEALVANLVVEFVTNFDAQVERCWIGECDGERLGSIFLVRDRDKEGVAILRMLLVDPSARGLGLGKALVRECLEFARKVGYRRVSLWTVSMLSAAIHIYRQAGFKLSSEEQAHRFGVDMVDQIWELEL